MKCCKFIYEATSNPEATEILDSQFCSEVLVETLFRDIVGELAPWLGFSTETSESGLNAEVIWKGEDRSCAVLSVAKSE